MSAQLQTAHLGHDPVADNQLDGVVLQEFACLAAVAGDHHIETPLLQQLAEIELDVECVFDHQDR